MDSDPGFLDFLPGGSFSEESSRRALDVAPLGGSTSFLAYCYVVCERWVKDHARGSSLYKPLMVLTASAAKQVSKQLPLENQSGKVLGGDMAWGLRWVQAEIESRLESMVCGYENVKGDTNLSSFTPFTFVCFFLVFILFCLLFSACIYSFSCLSWIQFSFPFIFISFILFSHYMGALLNFLFHYNVTHIFCFL